VPCAGAHIAIVCRILPSEGVSHLGIGSGDLQYELIRDWEPLSAGRSHPDVVAVCTDPGAASTYCLKANKLVTPLPAAVKRIQCSGDSRTCAEPGADGTCTSNDSVHYVDNAIIAVHALPKIREAAVVELRPG